MYPGEPFESIKLLNDDEGLHFGLFVNEKLITIISLFVENNKVQFRKLATEVEEQGKGYGSKMLNYIFEYVKKYDVENIWCNARIKKSKFYEKFGMIKTEKTYTKFGIDFVIMKKSLNNIKG